MPTTTLQFWLDSLLDRQNSFTISLLGLSGRLRLAPPWDVRQTLQDHLFYYVAEGSFEARRPGQRATVKAGALIWAGAGTCIHFRLPDDGKVVIWRFRLDARDQNGRPLPSPLPLWHVPQAHACELWMSQIKDEHTRPTSPEPERVRGLLLCLLTELGRCALPREMQNGILTPSQQKTLMDYLSRNIHRRLEIEQLADLVELSPDYFTRCFRRTYGQPPRTWILRERIHAAAVRLLETNLTVSQVAKEFDYDNVFLFSRQFKKVMGVGPVAYRKEHLEV